MVWRVHRRSPYDELTALGSLPGPRPQGTHRVNQGRKRAGPSPDVFDATLSPRYLAFEERKGLARIPITSLISTTFRTIKAEGPAMSRRPSQDQPPKISLKKRSIATLYWRSARSSEALVGVVKPCWAPL